MRFSYLLLLFVFSANAQLTAKGEPQVVVDADVGARYTGELVSVRQGELAALSYITPAGVAGFAILEEDSAPQILQVPEIQTSNGNPPALYSDGVANLFLSYADGSEMGLASFLQDQSANAKTLALNPAQLAELNWGCVVVGIAYDPSSQRVVFEASIATLLAAAQTTTFLVNVMVHCSDGTNRYAVIEQVEYTGIYGTAVSGNGGDGEPVPEFKQGPSAVPIAGSGKSGLSKMNLPPAPALPLNSISRLADNTSVHAYIAQPDLTPILSYFDSDLTFVRFLAMPDQASFSSQIRVCVSPGYRNPWVVWSDQSLNVKLARVVGDEISVISLGRGNGPNALACSVNDQAVVSFYEVDPLGQTLPELNLVAVDSQMAVIDRKVTELSGINAANIGLTIDETGEIIVAWGPFVGGPGQGAISLQRYQLADSTVAGGSIPGTWLDTEGSRSGQGWFLDVVDSNGEDTLIATFFGYLPDGTGPMWLIGQGPIIDGFANMTLVQTRAGQFNSLDNPANVVRSDWGIAMAAFKDCGRILMTTMANDGVNFDSGMLVPASNVTGTARFCDEHRAIPATSFSTGFPLTWFDPAKSGEGMFFSAVDNQAGQQLLMAYYTYENDGSGRPLWLFGSGQINNNNTASVQMFRGGGAGYGPGFDPAEVMLDVWGTAEVSRTDCNQVVVNWTQSQFGSGEIRLQPLTAPLDGGSCE